MKTKIAKKNSQKNHHTDSRSEVLVGWEFSHPARPIGFHVAPQAAPSRRRRPLKLKLDGHGCVIAGTGAGKSRSCVIPALLNPSNRTVVCVDVKGELVNVTRRFREQLGPVYIIDPFNLVTKNSAGLNPLDAFRFDSSDVFDQAMMMVELIRGGIPSGLKDPFWERTSGYLGSGLIACVAEHEDPAKRNLTTIFSKYLSATDFDYTLAAELDGGKVKPLAYQAIAAYLNLPERETRPSVKATFISNVACLASAAVEKVIQKTTFDLDAFRRGDPMTIYIVMPPGKLLSHSGLLRLLLGTLMNIIATRTSIPAQKTCFYVDEAAQLGYMPQLLEALTLLRSYGLQCTTYWQDLSQIQHHYPTAWQAILNNSALLQIFGLKNQFAARGLAEIVGVDARQLVEMADDEQLVLHNGKHIHIAKRLDYLKDSLFKGRWDPNPMFARSRPSRLPCLKPVNLAPNDGDHGNTV